MCLSIAGRKGQSHKMKIFSSQDMAMPKNQQQAAYYRTDSQTISKARTILSQNCSSSSVYNEVNHEAKISVSQEIGDPKQLWNLKNNLNKTKRKSSSNIGEVDRIVVAMKLEH